MRIVSKFKDYYDGALAFGQDEKIVYVRHTEEIVHEQGGGYHNGRTAEYLANQKIWEALPIRNISHINVHLKPEFRPEPRGWGYRNPMAKSGTISFCGKLYPFMILEIKNPAPKPMYGEAPALMINSFDKNFSEHVTVTRNWNQRDEQNYATYDEWFADNSGIDDPAMNLHLNSPVVIYEPYSKVIVNPCLKDYGFQKLMDPYTAFQEISMFVSGVLTNNPDPPNLQTDKAKVTSHGFDPKYGFRTPPKEKK